MKGIAKRSVVTTFAALAVAVTAFAFANPAVAQGQAQGSAPVTIVGPLPVPVTGAVSGTVAISNTPLPVVGTVGLTSGTVVSIGNTATNPVIVQTTSGREPFQARTIGRGRSRAMLCGSPNPASWLTEPTKQARAIHSANGSRSSGAGTRRRTQRRHAGSDRRSRSLMVAAGGSRSSVAA